MEFPFIVYVGKGKWEEYKLIEERECPVCEYDRATVTGVEIPGVHVVRCNACGEEIEQG